MLSGLLPYCLELSMPYDPMNQVHPGPLEGIDRIHADTAQARTGNTEREQEAWFAGVEEGQRRTEHNAAVRTSADGWKLVPIEPTPEMIKAWHDTYSKAVIKTGRSNRAYAAMLAAAPSPAAVAPGDAQDERQEFEAWFTRNDETKDIAERALRRSPSGAYVLMQTYTAWEIWQAARASVSAPATDDTPPRFTISASDRFELTGAVGLLRGCGYVGPAAALQRVLDAESASFSVQGEDDARDAGRYRWMRGRDLDVIVDGGVFAGLVPDNVVLNGEDLDAAIDAAIAAQLHKGGE